MLLTVRLYTPVQWFILGFDVSRVETTCSLNYGISDGHFGLDHALVVLNSRKAPLGGDLCTYVYIYIFIIYIYTCTYIYIYYIDNIIYYVIPCWPNNVESPVFICAAFGWSLLECVSRVSNFGQLPCFCHTSKVPSWCWSLPFMGIKTLPEISRGHQ